MPCQRRPPAEQHGGGQWPLQRRESVVADRGNGRRMRETHLPRVHVEWDNLDRERDARKWYNTTSEDWELEGLRLEWGYLLGRSDTLLSRILQNPSRSCDWEMLDEGSCSRAPASPRSWRRESLQDQSSVWTGRGYLALRSEAVVYVARCKEASVEFRNDTQCTHEIPMLFKGKEVFADPFTLVLQSMATPVSCQEDAPPRWKIEGEWFWGYSNTVPPPVWNKKFAIIMPTQMASLFLFRINLQWPMGHVYQLGNIPSVFYVFRCSHLPGQPLPLSQQWKSFCSSWWHWLSVKPLPSCIPRQSVTSPKLKSRKHLYPRQCIIYRGYTFFD